MMKRIVFFFCLFFLVNSSLVFAQCPAQMSIISLGKVKFTYDTAPAQAPVSFTYNGTNYSLSSISATEFVSDNFIVGITLGGEVIMHYDANTTGCVYNILGLLESTAPVELSFFSGKLNNNDIELYWKTDTESGNAGFEIQRSFDGEDFETLTMITGAGDSDETLAYSYTEEAIRIKALNDHVYYRLKQIDYDGGYAFSGIISVDLELDLQQFEITKITGWNTSERKIKVFFHCYVGIKKINLILADINGNIIERKSLYPNVGLNNFEFDLSDQKSNLYFLSLNNGKSIICEKIALASDY